MQTFKTENQPRVVSHCQKCISGLWWYLSLEKQIIPWVSKIRAPLSIDFPLCFITKIAFELIKCLIKALGELIYELQSVTKCTGKVGRAMWYKLRLVLSLLVQSPVRIISRSHREVAVDADPDNCRWLNSFGSFIKTPSLWCVSLTDITRRKFTEGLGLGLNLLISKARLWQSKKSKSTCHKATNVF